MWVYEATQMSDYDIEGQMSMKKMNLAIRKELKASLHTIL